MAAKFVVKSIVADILLGLGLVLIIIGGFSYLIHDGVSNTDAYISSVQQGKSDTSVTYSPGRFMLDYSQLNIKNNFHEDVKKELIEKDLPDEITIPDEININIKKGMSIAAVAQLLSNKGLVEADKFIKSIKVFNLDKRIKAGNYRFAADSELIDILLEIVIR